MHNFCLFYSSRLCLFQRDVNTGGAVAEGVATIGANVPKVHFSMFISEHSFAHRFGLLDIDGCFHCELFID